jgi:nucleoside-diphosphate-sugar epimerase
LNQSLISKLILCGLLKKEFKLCGGNQRRDFLYINDAIEGFIKASITKEAIGKVINLGSGKGYVINDIIKKIVDNIGDIKIDHSEPYRKGENMEFYNSNEKAKKLLNWEPKVSIDEGLRRTIKWYKDKYDNGKLKKWIIQN